MQRLKSQLSGAALVLAGLTGLALLTACCTVSKAPLFTATGPGWRVQEGQALWKFSRRAPELGGELVIASDQEGRCLVQFTKTPLPLVLAQTTPTDWFISFPPRHMSFAHRGTPPTRLMWLYLPRALAGEPLPPPLQFRRKPDGGWRLDNPRSGESIQGFLAP